jgi:hypothetical protein
MAGYNPQRTRPRPSVAADEPAPVDALLGASEVSEAADTVRITEPVVEVTEPVVEVSEPLVEASEPVPAAPYVPSTPSAAQRSRSRSRLMLVGALSATAVFAVVVLRRRRR